MAKITIDQLVDLAFAVEEGDPFDWSSFKQGKDQAMRMIAASILEICSSYGSPQDGFHGL